MKRWLNSPAYHQGRAALAVTTGLPISPPDEASTAIAEDQLTEWLARLRLLYGVPFHYLVPDQRMLPEEAIRLFVADPNWLTGLLDGAFSLGRTTTNDAPTATAEARRTQALLARAARQMPAIRARLLSQPSTGAATVGAATEVAAPPAMSGFVLRSGVVAAWPGLEARAYDANGTALVTLRLERLAGNVLLGLFVGVVQRVVFREPAEALHFGVEPSAGAFVKSLKYLTGTEPIGTKIPGQTVPVPLRDASTRVVNVAALQASMQQALVGSGGLGAHDAYTPAQFALEMVQGVQTIEFTF